jgi:hypothetical protein
MEPANRMGFGKAQVSYRTIFAHKGGNGKGRELRAKAPKRLTTAIEMAWLAAGYSPLSSSMPYEARQDAMPYGGLQDAIPW